MNQSTPMRRRVFLVGLTMPILVPIMRARAQGFVPPTPPGRAPFGLNWGMSFESIRKLFPIPPEDPPLPIPEGSPLEYLRYQPLERTSSEDGAAYVLFRGHMPSWAHRGQFGRPAAGSVKPRLSSSATSCP